LHLSNSAGCIPCPIYWLSFAGEGHVSPTLGSTQLCAAPRMLPPLKLIATTWAMAKSISVSCHNPALAHRSKAASLARSMVREIWSIRHTSRTASRAPMCRAVYWVWVHVINSPASTPAGPACWRWWDIFGLLSPGNKPPCHRVSCPISYYRRLQALKPLQNLPSRLQCLSQSVAFFHAHPPALINNHGTFSQSAAQRPTSAGFCGAFAEPLLRPVFL
jgi:hypothetical protein